MTKPLRSFLLATSLAFALVPNASAREFIYLISISWTSGPLEGIKSHGHVSVDDALAVPNSEYTAPNLIGRLSFGVRNTRYGLADMTTGFLSFDPASQVRIFIFGTNCAPGSCSASDNLNSLYFVYDSQSQLDRFYAIHGPAIDGQQSYGVGSLQPVPVRTGHDPFNFDR